MFAHIFRATKRREKPYCLPWPVAPYTYFSNYFVSRGGGRRASKRNCHNLRHCSLRT